MTAASPRRLVAALWTALLLAVGTLAAAQPAVAATTTTQLEAPTDVVAYAQDSGASVQWSEPVLAEGEYLDHYVVTSSPGGVAVTTWQTNVSVGGLTNGVAYTFTVRAVTTTDRESAESAPSLPVTPATTPGAPTGVVARSLDARVLVSWTPPASDGGMPVRWYTVTASPGGTGDLVSGDQTSVEVRGLANGTDYTFTVVALNDVGPGPASEASAPVTAQTAPPPPYDVTATPGDGSATVAWSTQMLFPGDSIDSFTVTPSPGGEPVTVRADQRSAVVPGLANGTAYTFTVTGTNAVGDGRPSEPSAPVTPRTRPGAPTGVSATAENWRSYVVWTPPASDGGSAVRQYVVTSSPDGATAVVTGDRRGAWVQGLRNGTAYTFTVTASNAAGRGPASQPSAAVTPHGSRADARVKLSTDTAYRGDNVYNTTATGQSVSTTARRGAVRTVQFSFQNDGATNEMYLVKGAAGSSPGFAVSYWVGSTDVTDRVVEGRFSPGTGEIRPGASVVLTARIRITGTARVGAVKSLVLRDVCDGEAALSDVVKATVKVVG